MNRIKYTPSDEIVEIVRQDISGNDPSENGYIAAVVAATLENTLAMLFGTIARSEAAYEDHDSKYTLTELGQFNDDVRSAIFSRIPLDTDHIDKFLRLLAIDLYEKSITNEIGGKWGYINCDNREINLIIEYRKQKPTHRPGWVKAELV